MKEFWEKFFSSPLTTLVAVILLIAAAALAFGIGGERAGADRETRQAQAEQEAVPATASAPAEDAGAAADDPAEAAVADTTAGAPEAEDGAPVPTASSDPAPPQPEPSDAAGGAQAPAEAQGAPAPRPSARRVAAGAQQRGPNSFNRLLKRPSSAPNAPPARDGIHDPSNPGTGLLQWPSVALADFPKTSDGNKVDWVKALKKGLIKPRYVADDPKAEPFLLDLVIVRQVKGSMPNVVYPHDAHTEWLDCSNCHDEIFKPQKGANQISMAGILLGQACGVCHGKVAFPVSDCRRCHSLPKTEAELRALAKRSNWVSGSNR